MRRRRWRPGFDAADYFGYPRRQYNRLREMESFLRRAVEPDLERSGLGLRLRYLSGGMSPSARLVAGRVIPERAGYYLGYRMTEALVAERGVAEAVRAGSSGSSRPAEGSARGIQSAPESRLDRTPLTQHRSRTAISLPHAKTSKNPIQHLIDIDGSE